MKTELALGTTPTVALTTRLIANESHVTATSLQVAQHFGKRHNDVLRAIRNLECSDQFRLRNFAQSSYLNEQGKAQPSYHITRDGFAFLAMGFTGKEAALWKETYINAFNQLEKAYLQRLLDQAAHVEPVPGIKHFRGKMSLAQTFKLYEQSHDAMRLLLAEPSPQGQQNLYWKLRQVNDTLGIPTAPMNEIVVAIEFERIEK